MSWSDGPELALQVNSIAEKVFAKKEEREFYMVEIIGAVLAYDADFEYLRGSALDPVLEKIETDGDARQKKYDAIRKKNSKCDARALNYVLGTLRYELEPEIYEFLRESDIKIIFIEEILPCLTKYLDDEDSLMYFLHALLHGYHFTDKELDDLVEKQDGLSDICRIYKNERDSLIKRKAKEKKKIKNFEEIKKTVMDIELKLAS